MTPDERLDKYLNLPQKMYSLFNDPEWALAASLGDMEFEQDMYDDIMYGDPFISNVPTGYKDTFNMENLPFNPLDIFPQYDYDKFAMKGLRKHAKEGIGRYFGPEITGGSDNQWNATWHPSFSYDIGPGPAGSWSREYQVPSIIDFNLPKMFSDYELQNKFTRDMLTRHHPPLYKHEWPSDSYQNLISDITRHEYKHGVVDNEHPYSHPAIYGTGAQYDIGSSGMLSDMGMFLNPAAYDEPIENYNPDIAGDVVRDVTDWKKPGNPHLG
jgi:hypothetical protein